jgi:DNA-binding transcriptional ArsR family regulator
LEIGDKLIPLRAMAHPLRLRILSLVAGAPMSAAEIAAELGILHAAASYHARQLARAGLLQVVEEAGGRIGPGRPPVRYRYDAAQRKRLDRSQGAQALWAALAQDVERRLRARKRHRVGADAEVWMAPADFERVCGHAKQISDLIHERARRPGTSEVVHGSVSVFAFELENGH